jgi:hypothetical protein
MYGFFGFVFLSYAEPVSMIVRLVVNSIRCVRSYGFKTSSEFELDKGLDPLRAMMERNYIIYNNIVEHWVA